MDNQEAIKILDNLKPGDYSNPYEKGEAIVMAISALQEQEEKTQLSAEGTTSDLISRQDEIFTLCSECQCRRIPCANYPCGSVKTLLMRLPSTPPEPLVKESRTLVKDLVKEPCEDAVSREAVTDVIRHSDIFSTWCEMDDTDDIVAEVIDEARKQLVDDVNELPSVTPKCPECDDAVSREAAIDAAIEAADEWDGGYDVQRAHMIEDAIKTLPSAEPDRKTGWWMIREGISDAQCSECGMYFRDVYDMDNSDSFCRHCGTKMEGLKVVEDE